MRISRILRVSVRFALVRALPISTHRPLVLVPKTALCPVGKQHVRGAGEAADDGEGLGGSGATDLGLFPKWSPSQDDPGRRSGEGRNHTFIIWQWQSKHLISCKIISFTEPQLNYFTVT